MRMLEEKEQPRFSARDLSRINWFLGATLALVSFWTAALLDFGVRGLLGLAASLTVLAVLRPQMIGWIPRWLWKVMPLFLLVGFALDLYLNANPMPALVRLIILLILYRVLSFRKKREDLQLVVLGLFLIIISGVTINNIGFFVQILLFAALAMVLLFNLTLLGPMREGMVQAEVWRGFSWGPFLTRTGSKLKAGSTVTALLVFGSVVVCAAFFFVIIPRVDLNHRLALLGVGGGSQTGFSETLRFGDVTNLHNNHKVALRIEVDSAETIPGDPYWRMLVLDDYHNGVFQVSRPIISNAETYSRASEWVPNFPRENRAADDGEGGPDATTSPPSNRWTFYMEGGVARYLPLTGKFSRIRFQEASGFSYLRPFHAISMNRSTRSMMVYQVEDMEIASEFWEPEFGTYTLDYPFFPEVDLFMDVEYFNYPDTTLLVPARPDDLATLEELVAIIDGGENLNARAFAARATKFLQANHSYSMSYTLEYERGDHVVRWLRSGSPGHCEAFAGALVLLCRTAGFHSRAVVGFRGGTWNSYENYFMVRHSDAHAWVEVFDGKDTWFRVDPTPGGWSGDGDGEGEIITALFSPDSSFGAYLDSLRMLWYRRVVSFDQQSQFQVVGWFKDHWKNTLRLRERFAVARDGLIMWLTGPRSFRWALEGLGMITVVALTAFLFAFLFRGDFRRRFVAWAERDKDPVRSKAGRYLLRLEEWRSQAGWEEATGEQSALALEFALQRLRFGPLKYRPTGPAVFRQARHFFRRR